MTDVAPLHVVIRSPERKAYFTSDGQWSPRLGGARTFTTIAQAEEACRAERLRDVEIVIMRPNRTVTLIPFPGSAIAGTKRRGGDKEDQRESA